MATDENAANNSKTTCTVYFMLVMGKIQAKTKGLEDSILTELIAQLRDLCFWKGQGPSSSKQPLLKSYIFVLAQEGKVKKVNLERFPCHGLEAFGAEMKIFLYKPRVKNTLAMLNLNVILWKKWLCLLTEALNQCYQKWQEKIGIETQEGYFLTKNEDALQLLF